MYFCLPLSVYHCPGKVTDEREWSSTHQGKVQSFTDLEGARTGPIPLFYENITSPSLHSSMEPVLSPPIKSLRNSHSMLDDRRFSKIHRDKELVKPFGDNGFKKKLSEMLGQGGRGPTKSKISACETSERIFVVYIAVYLTTMKRFGEECY